MIYNHIHSSKLENCVYDTTLAVVLFMISPENLSLVIIILTGITGTRNVLFLITFGSFFYFFIFYILTSVIIKLCEL